MKFRKRPLVVDAQQFLPTNAADVAAWSGGQLVKSEGRLELAIATRDGEMRASTGDWVIQEPAPTSDRRFYPCKPDIFDATYEMFEPPPAYVDDAERYRNPAPTTLDEQLARLRVGPVRSHVLGAAGAGRITALDADGATVSFDRSKASPYGGIVHIHEPQLLARLEVVDEELAR